MGANEKPNRKNADARTRTLKSASTAISPTASLVWIFHADPVTLEVNLYESVSVQSLRSVAALKSHSLPPCDAADGNAQSSPQLLSPVEPSHHTYPWSSCLGAANHLFTWSLVAAVALIDPLAADASHQLPIMESHSRQDGRVEYPMVCPPTLMAESRMCRNANSFKNASNELSALTKRIKLFSDVWSDGVYTSFSSGGGSSGPVLPLSQAHSENANKPHNKQLNSFFIALPLLLRSAFQSRDRNAFYEILLKEYKQHDTR